MENKENKERRAEYRQRLIAHKERSANYAFYSIQRIDLLIIAISGVGIYIILELLKFIKTTLIFKDVDTCYLKIGGALFVLAIVLNFVSQWIGYYVNRNEEDWVEEMLSESDAEADKLNNKVQLLNSILRYLNISATFLMLIGVVLLTIYIMITF